MLKMIINQQLSHPLSGTDQKRMASLTDVLVDYSKFCSDSMPDYKPGHIVR